ncbi:MAG: hypothetical protein V7604_4193 [Hyphomicrobiales bacterium]
MSIFTFRIPALLAAGSILCVAAAGMASAHLSGPGIFHATEAMSYVIGSKRAVGYFQSVSGKCQLTLMIAEATDPDVAMPPSAARMSLSLIPGQSVALGSAEGESMTATCGSGGETIEIKRNAFHRT